MNPRRLPLAPRPFSPDLSLRGIDLLVSHLLTYPQAWERVTTQSLGDALDGVTSLVDLVDDASIETAIAINSLVHFCGTGAVDIVRAMSQAGHTDPKAVAIACRAGLRPADAAAFPIGQTSTLTARVWSTCRFVARTAVRDAAEVPPR